MERKNNLHFSNVFISLDFSFVQLYVSDNLGDHMSKCRDPVCFCFVFLLASHLTFFIFDCPVGHVYCKFADEEQASDALQIMNGRSYGKSVALLWRNTMYST